MSRPINRVYQYAYISFKIQLSEHETNIKGSQEIQSQYVFKQNKQNRRIL